MMSQETYRFSWKDLPKLLVVVLAISVICLMFPSYEQQSFEYSIGQKWPYNDLVSDKDFTARIQVSPGEILTPLLNQVYTTNRVVHLYLKDNMSQTQ